MLPNAWWMMTSWFNLKRSLECFFAWSWAHVWNLAHHHFSEMDVFWSFARIFQFQALSCLGCWCRYWILMNNSWNVHVIPALIGQRVGQASLMEAHHEPSVCSRSAPLISLDGHLWSTESSCLSGFGLAAPRLCVYIYASYAIYHYLLRWCWITWLLLKNICYKPVAESMRFVPGLTYPIIQWGW